MELKKKKSTPAQNKLKKKKKKNLIFFLLKKLYVEYNEAFMKQANKPQFGFFLFPSANRIYLSSTHWLDQNDCQLLKICYMFRDVVC